jgi:uncharacterized protein (DUF362 family)
MTEKRFSASIVRCANYDRPLVEHAIAEAIAPFGGMAAFVQPGWRVAIKPNFIVAADSGKAVTTHPEVIRAVALAVQNAGASPFIADSPAFGSAHAVARRCGVKAVADELGIPIIDLGRRPRPLTLGPDAPIPSVKVGGDVLEADAIINLPKWKTHCQVGISLGTKNLFGCVAGKRKALLHFRLGENPDRFCEMIVCVSRALAPTLTIIDGVVSLQRHGPSRGDPRPLGLLVASPHPVAADRVAIDIMGANDVVVPYLDAAKRLGYGPNSLDEILLHGVSIEDVRVHDYVFVPQDRMQPLLFSLPRVVASVMRHIKTRIRHAFEKTQ